MYRGSMCNTFHEKARNIITQITGDSAQAEAIITALSDEHLLFVDLPEPDEEGRFHVEDRPFWVSGKNRPCVEARGLNGFVAAEGATIPLGEDGECLDVVRALLAAHHQDSRND